MIFCETVMADVKGVSMMATRHARVVVAVDAPYSTRRPYIPGESEKKWGLVYDTQKPNETYLSRVRARQGRKLGAETDCI